MADRVNENIHCREHVVYTGACAWCQREAQYYWTVAVAPKRVSSAYRKPARRAR